MTPIQVLRRGVTRRVELVPMNPVDQLRAGRLVHRVSQLLVGLVLFGISMALLLRANLGLEPWGVLQYGLIQHIPMSYGAMSIVVSFVVLLLWIPMTTALSTVPRPGHWRSGIHRSSTTNDTTMLISP